MSVGVGADRPDPLKQVAARAVAEPYQAASMVAERAEHQDVEAFAEVVQEYAVAAAASLDSATRYRNSVPSYARALDGPQDPSFSRDRLTDAMAAAACGFDDLEDARSEVDTAYQDAQWSERAASLASVGSDGIAPVHRKARSVILSTDVPGEFGTTAEDVLAENGVL